MEIVVTGPTGKLGGALVRLWQGEHTVHALGRDALDLAAPGEIERQLAGHSFDAIVNCAAMANPENCEANPVDARRVNTESPGELSRVCRERGARLVHFSTDYVLDGRDEGLKDESASTKPLSTYAGTKLAGEDLVMEGDPHSVVCRVSWIFGTNPPGFLESFLQCARDGKDLAAIADKYSKPTSAAEIARVVMALLERDLTGLFHLTHEGEPESWWSYATKVLALAHKGGWIEEMREVRPQALADFPNMAALRPIHTSMQPGRLVRELGWQGPLWEEAARVRIERLLEWGRAPRGSPQIPDLERD
ncbi:MAG: NAD(P)-dependent oxidoreductase [Roseibacillus sp.]